MYIVFEGIDGAGKSTQINLLKDWLDQNGFDVETVVEPTDSEVGKLIRKILQRPDATTDRIQKTLGLLFAADRMLIMDKLNDDSKVILSDRSFISSLAYQEPAEWIEQINKYAKEPDLVLLLDVDVKTSVNRCSKEDEFENEEFLSKVKANYLDLISNFNHEIIDASTGVNKVSTDIKKAVAPYMGIFVLIVLGDSMCEVLNNVVNVISGLDGVLEVRQLSNDDILKIIDMEAQRSKDIVPVFNEGVQECFKRDVCFVIFKKGYFRVPPTPTVLLTFDGEILGHDVFDPEDKKKFRDDEDIMFLSDDFVIFKDVLNNYNLEKGNEYFVLPPVPFPELDPFKLDGVVSSSPSTKSDEYLKNKYSYGDDSSIATIIVSFNI